MNEEEINYIEPKSVLSKWREKKNEWGIAYELSLYGGCSYGCMYCEVPGRLHAGDRSVISVPHRAVELLQEALDEKRTKGTIGIGLTTEPYMPLEKEMELTRQALAVIADRGFPVHVLTKSDLVCRDVDVLKKVSRTYAAVTFSMTTVDDALARLVEPDLPLPSVRLQAMKHLADQGIYTGVALRPVLPFVNDAIEDVLAVVEQAAEMGASYVLPFFGLTLSPRYRPYFLERIAAIFPKMPQRYQVYFEDRQECMSPNAYYLNEYFQSKIMELGLTSKIKRYHPKENGQLSLF